MTLSLIEALKTSIYSPKYINNTKPHFQQFFFFFKVPYFSKNCVPTNHRFTFLFMARLWRAYKSSIYIYIYT